MAPTRSHPDLAGTRVVCCHVPDNCNNNLEFCSLVKHSGEGQEGVLASHGTGRSVSGPEALDRTGRLVPGPEAPDWTEPPATRPLRVLTGTGPSKKAPVRTGVHATHQLGVQKGTMRHKKGIEQNRIRACDPVWSSSPVYGPVRCAALGPRRTGL